MAYIKENWVEVPDPSNPPAGAPSLNADVLNKIEQGIVDVHDAVAKSYSEFSTLRDEVKQSIGTVRDFSNPDITYSFEPYNKYFFSRKGETYGGQAALSPNGRFLAVRNFENNNGDLVLYRTSDMTIIGSIPHTDIGGSSMGDCRIEIDNDFGVICVCARDYNSNSNSQYSYGHYKFNSSYYQLVFFKFDNTSITCLGNILGTAPGRLPADTPFRGLSQSSGSSAEHFWVILENYPSVYLYCINKKDNSASLIKTYSKLYQHNANTSSYYTTLKTFNLYRNNDSATVMCYHHHYVTQDYNSSYSRYQYFYTPRGFTMSIEKVYPDKSSEVLLDFVSTEACDSIAFPYPQIAEYDPSKNIIVVSGEFRSFVSSGLSRNKLTHIYDINGELINSAKISPIAEYSSYTGSYYGYDMAWIGASHKKGFVRNGILYYCDSASSYKQFALDLETLKEYNNLLSNGSYSHRILAPYPSGDPLSNEGMRTLCSYKTDSLLDNCNIMIQGYNYYPYVEVYPNTIVAARGIWIENKPKET